VASEAHIFPHALGGSAFTRDTICTSCNGRVNRTVEEPSLSAFDFFRSFFGIESRRGRVRPVRGTVTVEGREAVAHLDERGEPKHSIVIRGTTPDGRETLTVIGPQHLVEDAYRKASARRPPPSSIEEGEFHDIVFIEIEDLARRELRRLAAKVAFEHFAAEFGSAAATTSEFDELRDFILDGTEPSAAVVGLLFEQSHLGGPMAFSVLTHAAYLVAHPDESVLGCFVVFFGVFYYWVILSKEHKAPSPRNHLLVEYPSDRSHHRTSAASSTGVRVNWNLVIDAYLKDPAGAVLEAKRKAAAKFQAFVDSHMQSGPSNTSETPQDSNGVE
jgi:hypothetical protein